MSDPLRGRVRALVGGAALVLLAGSGAATELADPTRPPFFDVPGVVGAGGARAERMVLSSVLISPGRRVAVINGERVSVGGEVDGATVVEIREGYARLERSGAQVELFLRPVTVKTHRSPDQ